MILVTVIPRAMLPAFGVLSLATDLVHTLDKNTLDCHAIKL